MGSIISQQYAGIDIPKLENEDSQSLLSVDSDKWAQIQEHIKKNAAFKNNRKEEYFAAVIGDKFTNNAEMIPSFNFPLTKYFVIMLSTLYSAKTVLPAIDPANEILDTTNVLFTLDSLQQDAFLNEVGFVRINNGDLVKCKLESVKCYDLLYDLNFENVLLRVKQIPKKKSIFEYYQVIEDGCLYYTLESNSFSQAAKINWDALTPEIIQTFNIKLKGKLPTMPIIPLFFNDEPTANLSPVVVADEILNILIMFGLAGMPSSMLVKWWMTKMASVQGTSKEQQKSLFDMLEAIVLNTQGPTEEKIGTVGTGNGESFKNMMIIFEAIVSWLGQMMGISKTTLKSQLREVRQAAASKFVEGKGSDIYRSHLIILFDEFEQRLFNAIGKFYPKLDIKNMKPIDKDNLSLLADSGDLMEYLIEGVREKFIPYIEALAKLHGITKEEAVKKAKEIEDDYKKYLEEADLMMQNAGNSGKTSPKTKYGLKKGTINGKIVKEGGGNEVEDKGGAV